MSLDVDALYRRYGPMVLRRCRFLLRDEERSVDAMHDVFVNLLNGAGSLQVDPDAASSLLHRVATNVCLNRLRGERRRPQDPDEALLLEIASLDDLEGRTAAGAVLGRLFGREPESTRTMAVLRGLREKLDALQVNEVAR